MNLLLLADPDENMVLEYIGLGDMFLLEINQVPVSISIVVPLCKKTLEIKNLATKPDFQNLGYVSKLINYIINHYKANFKEIYVGTANSSLDNIRFYKNLGFTYSHKINNFFLKNYRNKIFENGIQAVDILYFKFTLKKNS